MWDRLIAPGMEFGTVFFLLPVLLMLEFLNRRRDRLARPVLSGFLAGASLGLVAGGITMGLTMAGVFGRYESAMGGVLLAIFLSVGGLVPGILAGLFYRFLGTTLLARVRRRRG